MPSAANRDAAEHSLHAGDDPGRRDRRRHQFARLPDEPVALRPIDRQRAADGVNQLVAVAEQEERGEQHDHQVEQEHRHVLQQVAGLGREECADPLRDIHQRRRDVEQRLAAGAALHPAPGALDPRQPPFFERALDVAGGLHRLTHECGRDQDERRNDDHRDSRGAQRRGARRAEARLEARMNGVEDDHQHRRPAERHEERLDHQEHEVDEDRQRDVEENRGDMLPVGERHHAVL